MKESAALNTARPWSANARALAVQISSSMYLGCQYVAGSVRAVCSSYVHANEVIFTQQTTSKQALSLGAVALFKISPYLKGSLHLTS